jgi:hypothetical protein
MKLFLTQQKTFLLLLKPACFERQKIIRWQNLSLLKKSENNVPHYSGTGLHFSVVIFYSKI